MDTHALPKASQLAADLVVRAARHPRWQPGLPLPLHSEIFAPASQASGAGAALALMQGALMQGVVRGPEQGEAAATADNRQVLWVQDAHAMRLAGRPCHAGLAESLRHRLIHVAAKRPEDALFAMEEGLRCRDLALVLGEMAGNPRALTFTASRRLSLTAYKHGVPLVLVRLDARPDLSSARMRWRIVSAPSTAPRWNPAGPGLPAWQADLFRARHHLPGEWILRDEPEGLAAQPVPAAAPPDHGDLVRAAGARSLAAL